VLCIDQRSTRWVSRIGADGAPVRPDPPQVRVEIRVIEVQHLGPGDTLDPCVAAKGRPVELGGALEGHLLERGDVLEDRLGEPGAPKVA
jgi:hypothetical protein